MRFSTVVSSLLCFSSVLGASLHQHLVKKATTDICVSLDLNLEIGHIVLGHIDACVCISTLDIFIETNVQIREAVRYFGAPAIKEWLTAEIYAHEQKVKCSYPVHAVPAPAPTCQRDSDPCGFSCNDGYTANEQRRTCECEYPNIVYNGKCIPKPGKPGQPQPSSKPKGYPKY